MTNKHIKLWYSISEKIEGLLCFSCGKHTPLTAESFIEMLQVTPYGESGSNGRIQSEEVFMNFESFLYDVQGNVCMYIYRKLRSISSLSCQNINWKSYIIKTYDLYSSEIIRLWSLLL